MLGAVAPGGERVAIVTGASSGIGRATALAYARRGFDVAVVARRAELLAALVGELRPLAPRSFFLAGDLGERAFAERVVDETAARLGRVDVLVNNAAIGPEANSPRYLADKPKFWTTPDDLWLRMLRVNVFGAQLMTRTFVHGMLDRGWGRIVNITTSLDTMYRQGIGAYGPCKAALEASTRIMAQDLDRTGVTANVLVPGGPVNTRMVPRESGLDAAELIQPEQMLAPLLWLCSPSADAVTGIRIVAQKWREDLPIEARLQHASAPVAWPQLGAQSLFPDAR
jgi:NAD(P)-dependent dehydrogenase (short-subunit alcohol dehydrogenase family)